MSGYTLVESSKAKRVKKAAEKAQKVVQDEYDLILDRMDDDNEHQYQKLKAVIASQVSDTDGVDATTISTPELIARGKLLITADNPTGQPPGHDNQLPGMLTLLNRIQTYATILQKPIGLSSPSLPKQGNFTFPPGRALKNERKSPAIPKVTAKTSKTVKFASDTKPLAMEKKTLTTKQYAVSTVQQPRYQREPSSRSRGDTAINRFGAWTSGVKTYATSALSSPGKEQLLGIDDGLLDAIDSDESDLDIMEPAAKKARTDEEALQLTGYPLLPADSMVADMDIDIMSDAGNAGGDGSVEDQQDVNIDEKEVESLSTDDSQAVHIFFKEELETLQHGKNAHLFYDCIEPLPQGVYEHTPAVVHRAGVFHQPFDCPPEYRLPMLPEAQAVMTEIEQRSCQSKHIAHQYSYLCQSTFWNVESIDGLRDTLLQLTSANHMDIVMLGQGFTNSEWDPTQSLQHDAQKLWYYLHKYGRLQYGTVVTDYSEVPLADVTLSFLMMLPINAVFGYLSYHGVAIDRLPWKLLSTVTALQQLPMTTRVPYSEWHNYLVVLLGYLHDLLRNEAESYSFMHTQFKVLVSPTLTSRDAEVFINHHFPDEGRLLTVAAAKSKSSDHLALLKRATSFAVRRKYKGEVFEQCNGKWVVFLYYVLHNSYPPALADGKLNTEHCVLSIASSVQDRHRMALDLRRLMQGHHSLISAMLDDHTLAIRLYGTSGKNAPVGVQKLMAAGVAYMFFWLLHNSKAYGKHENIDEFIPLDVMAFILSAGGILAPTNDGQPVFTSNCIPIHEMRTVFETAATLIRTQEPCILSLPPSNIHAGLTSDDYRDHFEQPLRMDAEASTRRMQQRLSDFHKSTSPYRALSTATCLFPEGSQQLPSGVSPTRGRSYFLEAGVRLVRAMHKPLSIAAAPTKSLSSNPAKTTGSSSSIRASSPKRPSSSEVPAKPRSKGTPLKQSFLVRTNGRVEISKTVPLVDTMSLDELLRRNAAKQAQLAKANQSNQGHAPLAVMQPRYKADTYMVNMYDSFKDVGKMYSTDWKALADGFEGNSKYLAELRFLDQASTPIKKRDKLIMLYDVNGIMTSLFNCSHLLYTVHSVIGTKTYARLTESMWTVGPDHVEDFFPEKIMMQIPGAYILFEEGTSTAPLQSSVNQSSSPACQFDSHSRDRTIDDETSSSDDDGSSVSDKSQSDESGERHSTKTPSIKTGRMTFKVLGKTAIRDDLQNAIAICNMVEEGRLEILLAPLGVYGHTMTPTNIINGIFRHGMEDSDFNVENLNVPVKQNKALVQSQAWTPYKNLYTNMAYQRYQLVANMTEDSIRSVHFLQLKLAVERNYVLASWNDWVMHLEGYKQFVHELYGTIYSTCVQNMVLEVQSLRLGERHSVTYLDVLSNAFRTQLYHFASRDISFKAPGQQEVRHPQKMTPTEWVDVMNALWTDFKGKLNVQQEMSFNYSQSQFKLTDPKPMGHKIKLVQQILQQKPAEGKLANDAVKADKRSPQPGKKQRAKKSPGAAKDDTIYVCVADLLNHYGSTEQIQCKTPCRYIHYDNLPPKTSRSGVLKRSMFVADALKLSEATKTWLRGKISKDKKLQ